MSMSTKLCVSKCICLCVQYQVTYLSCFLSPSSSEDPSDPPELYKPAERKLVSLSDSILGLVFTLTLEVPPLRPLDEDGAATPQVRCARPFRSP
mmetsp:Transcript_18711/g.47322  ORF Transcript_18711/g.47322 Transcript_18711/m.47322 type:complete len:94 (+) Transcript_18711:183-464(+)